MTGGHDIEEACCLMYPKSTCSLEQGAKVNSDLPWITEHPKGFGWLVGHTPGSVRDQPGSAVNTQYSRPSGPHCLQTICSAVFASVSVAQWNIYCLCSGGLLCQLLESLSDLGVLYPVWHGLLMIIISHPRGLNFKPFFSKDFSYTLHWITSQTVAHLVSFCQT